MVVTSSQQTVYCRGETHEYTVYTYIRRHLGTQYTKTEAKAHHEPGDNLFSYFIPV